MTLSRDLKNIVHYVTFTIYEQYDITKSELLFLFTRHT